MYVVAATAVTDELHFAGGQEPVVVPGGAGIYALCGIRLWTDEVLLATGVGQDFNDKYESWFRNNGIDQSGLIVRNMMTPYTVVKYFADGEREEIPRYGAAHYKNIEITAAELAEYFQTAKGIYIFKNSDPSFWNPLIEYKQNSKAVVMWEAASDATIPEHVAEVKNIAQNVDIFSVNMTESKIMLETGQIDEIIKIYQSWAVPLVFLRNGAAGALMITPDTWVAVPSLPDVSVADPTGGGNSSSGAVLYGYAEGLPPEVCGRMGSISAAMCIRQYGVPEIINEAMRKEAEAIVK